MLLRLGIVGVLALLVGVLSVAQRAADTTAPAPQVADVPYVFKGLTGEELTAPSVLDDITPIEAAAAVRHSFDARHKNGSEPSGRLYPIEVSQ
jgi:hypothetical protein